MSVETELEFPGGTVVIDEGRIWRALEAWCSTGEPRVIARIARINGVWIVELRDGSASHTGSSTRGMLDAIAQALTVALFPEEDK